MHKKQVGGLLLLLATLFFLITVFFEYQIGWIGTDRPRAETPFFIRDHWPQLQLIWSGQAASHLVFTLAYVLLFLDSRTWLRWLWGILVLCGLGLVIALVMTLITYPSALEALSEDPEVFSAVRDQVRMIYSPSQLGALFLTLIFLVETFRRESALGRLPGLITLITVLCAVLLGIFTSIPMKLIGLIWFLIPSVLGFTYWRLKKA